MLISFSKVLGKIFNALLCVNLAFRGKTTASPGTDLALREKTTAFPDVNLALREKTTAFPDVNLALCGNITAFLHIDLALRESFPAFRGNTTALHDEMNENLSKVKLYTGNILVNKELLCVCFVCVCVCVCVCTATRVSEEVVFKKAVNIGFWCFFNGSLSFSIHPQKIQLR